MKTILTTIILISAYVAQSQSTVLTEAAKYNCTPIDKIWFAQQVSRGDTNYLMMLECDTKHKAATNEVTIYFDNDSLNYFCEVKCDAKKYVMTYYYSASIVMDSDLIKECLTHNIVGYKLAGSYEKISSKKYKGYFTSIYK